MDSLSARQRQTFPLQFVIASLLALAGWWLAAPTAQAADISVGGACSLTEAIVAANTDSGFGGCATGSGADTVILDAGASYTLTFSNNTFGNLGRNGLPPITSTITISGNGATILRDPTLTCTGSSAFRIFYVSDTGDLLLHDLTVRNGCTENSSAEKFHNSGSGLFNDGGAVVVQSSSIVSNTAGYYGGGIYNVGGSAVISITQQSTVQANTAGDDGGGIYNVDGTVAVESSHILSNRAGSEGGGIHNNGGTVNVQASQVAANRAGNGLGGGLFNDNLMTVAGSVISGNVAADTGGGIYNVGAAAALTVTDSTLRANRATSNGGGLGNITGTLTISGSQMYSNTAGNDGGGLANQGGNVTIGGSHILSNTAGNGGGGGLSNEGATALMLLTQQSTILSNTALFGGGLANQSGNVTIESSQILDNAARFGGGGLSNTGATAVLHVTQQSTVAANVSGSTGGGISNSGGSLRMENSRVLSNTTRNSGGGLINNAGGSVSVQNSHILSNTAGISGGGLYNVAGSVAVQSSSIVANTAIRGNGGGFFNIDASASLSVTQQSTIAANRTGSSGGAFANNGGSLYVEMSSILSNTAAGNGGGLTNWDGTSTVIESCIVGNSDTVVQHNSGPAIMATDNWWGRADGPSGAGPGSGDSVSANVTFTNFETAPLPGCATLLPHVAVSKQANVGLARVGETVTYTVRMTNTSALTLTNIVVQDEPLGALPVTPTQLAPGQSTQVQVTYTVQLSDLPGPLVNTLTVTGTPSSGRAIPVQASAQVDLVYAAFTFAKTVGIEGIEPACTGISEETVPVSTTVVYCYTLTNTGDVTLTQHTLVDDPLGVLLDNVALSVAPGSSYSTTVTRTVTVSVTNVATWTAFYNAPLLVRDAGYDAPLLVRDAGYAGSDEVAATTSAGDLIAAAVPARNQQSATVRISGPTEDQDDDGIPDNVEGADDLDGDNLPNFRDTNSDGDTLSDREEAGDDPANPLDSNGDGTPDFLDPNQPTNLDETEQPDPHRRYLPWLRGTGKVDATQIDADRALFLPWIGDGP